MIGERLLKAINEQIKNELESYYLYLSMAAYFHSKSLDGMATWMRAQAHEEMIHAMKFFDHIIERNSEVTLLDVKQIKTNWRDVVEPWQEAYAHEQFITSKINDLITIAREEKEYGSEPILAWFAKEQVEEEANTGKIADEMAMVGDNKVGILMLDRELAARAIAPVSPFDPAAQKESSDA